MDHQHSWWEPQEFAVEVNSILLLVVWWTAQALMLQLLEFSAVSTGCVHCAWGNWLLLLYMESNNKGSTKWNSCICILLYCFSWNFTTSYQSSLKLVVNSSDSDRGNLRLVGGNSTAGRLQMQLDGEWTQVCSDSFSAAAANVACSQLLGLRSTGTVHTDGR